MRIISKSRWHFHGTHKGYSIEIERERGGRYEEMRNRFYIIVKNDFGYAYDGWAPEGITTMKEAKAEALRGAMIERKAG